MPEIAESASASPCTETPRPRGTARGTAAHAAPDPDGEFDLLKAREVAALLRVSSMTVYRLIHSGELRCVHVGRRSMRIPRASYAEVAAMRVGTTT